MATPGVRVGIGNPESVCLGLYSIELLEKNQLMESVMQNVVTFGASCSKTANLAAMSKVDAVLGWRVFHFWNPNRLDYIPIAKDKIPRISYIPIAIPVFTRDRALSEMFIEFALSDKGKAAYEKHGYLSRDDKARSFAPEATIGGEFALSQKYRTFISNHWQSK